MAMARAGTRRLVVEAAAGTQTRVIPANGEGIGLAHIGHPSIFMVFGVHQRHGACPTFPTATTVTGARCGILTQNGESPSAAGVIRNQRLAQIVVGGRDHGASHKAHGCRSRVATSYCASRALAAAKAIGSRSPVRPGWCRNRIRCLLHAVAARPPDRKL